MLIDLDSKPEETILYIAMQINKNLSNRNCIKIAELDSLYSQVNSNQPAFKYTLALNFLFMLNKIEIVNNEVRYVSN